MLSQVTKQITPNKSPSCLNCGEALDLLDTKNGKDREFCRYGGRPECGECMRFFPKGTETCPDCRIKLKAKKKCLDCNRVMKNNEKKCPKCENEITTIKKCSRCNLVHEADEINCRNCRIKVRTPACVKEYSIYVTRLNQVRNELMADPKERLKMATMFEIFCNTVTVSRAEEGTLENLVQVEIDK